MIFVMIADDRGKGEILPSQHTTHCNRCKGRQFDKNGNLQQWWRNATIEKFRARAQCIIDQYSSYVLEDIGLNVNGKMTQGENIADNGGLKQSYRVRLHLDTTMSSSLIILLSPVRRPLKSGNHTTASNQHFRV